MDDKTAPAIEESFAEAMVHSHRPHRVLGFALKPFCRWHAAQLDWVESPFAGHTKYRADFTALYIAAAICCSQFPRRPQLQLNRLGRLLRFIRLKKYLLPLHVELSRFCAYMRDYGGSPEYIVKDDVDSEAKKVVTPWYLYEVATLSQGRIEARAEAWNISLGEGNWWIAAANEARGADIDIITPEDRAQLAELGLNED